MKPRILLLAFTALALGSCSTYKSGQTPDDVYYSPGVERTGYVNTENQNRDNAEDGYVDMDDRYLRMKSSSKRWSAFDDDFMYWNNPTWNTQFMFNSFYSPWGWNSGWSMGIGYGNPWMWSSPWGWNSLGVWGRPYWNNPFCPTFYGNPVVVVAPKPYMVNPRANGPRTYNLNAYNPNNGRPVYSDPKLGKTYYNAGNTSGRNSGVRVFSNPDNGSGYSRSSRYAGEGYQNSGSRPRGGYNINDNGGSRTSSPSRTFERSNNNNSNFGGSSSPSRSSGGGSSSGSAPTRSFGRGGGN